MAINLPFGAMDAILATLKFNEPYNVTMDIQWHNAYPFNVHLFRFSMEQMQE